jgi:hypothetical protein
VDIPATHLVQNSDDPFRKFPPEKFPRERNKYRDPRGRFGYAAQVKDSQVIEEIRQWVSTMVIGLGLCPFADKPNRAGTIRYTVCPSNEPADVLVAVADELELLVKTPRSEIETTLLITPAMYRDFLDFNDFVGDAEQELQKLDLTGVIQIVGFHPEFRFAGVDLDSTENYTNRSPYPMLHLLREISVSEAAESFGDLASIPTRNTAVIAKLGVAGILERLNKTIH